MADKNDSSGGDFYSNIAVAMPGGQLECEACGRTLKLNHNKTASYLKSGWPKCHGYTMRLITTRELSQRLSKTGADDE
jgi:hypothetical protein